MAENTLEAPSVSQEVAALRSSPVGYLAREMAAGSVSGDRGIALRELPFLTQIGLRVVPGSATAKVMESALGLSLPQRVGEVGGDGTLSVLWQGPDEFLLIGAPDSVDAASLAELTDLVAMLTALRVAMDAPPPTQMRPRTSVPSMVKKRRLSLSISEV